MVDTNLYATFETFLCPVLFSRNPSFVLIIPAFRLCSCFPVFVLCTTFLSHDFFITFQNTSGFGATYKMEMAVYSCPSIRSSSRNGRGFAVYPFHFQTETGGRYHALFWR